MSSFTNIVNNDGGAKTLSINRSFLKTATKNSCNNIFLKFIINLSSRQYILYIMKCMYLRDVLYWSDSQQIQLYIYAANVFAKHDTINGTKKLQKKINVTLSLLNDIKALKTKYASLETCINFNIEQTPHSSCCHGASVTPSEHLCASGIW